MKMNKFFISALLGAISVMLGAFAAHGLKSLVPADQITSFNIGTKYQLIHSVLLLLVSIVSVKYPHKLLNQAFYAIFTGILLFSGSIYLLTTREIIGLHSYKWLVPLTPIGGLLIITGWILLALWGYKYYSIFSKNT